MTNPFQFADLDNPAYRAKLADVRKLSRSYNTLDENYHRLMKERNDLETIIDVALDLAASGGVRITREFLNYEVARINWANHFWRDIFKAKPEFPDFETWKAQQDQ